MSTSLSPTLASAVALLVALAIGPPTGEAAPLPCGSSPEGYAAVLQKIGSDCECSPEVSSGQFASCWKPIVVDGIRNGVISRACSKPLRRGLRNSTCGRGIDSVVCRQVRLDGRSTCKVTDTLEDCQPPTGGTSWVDNSPLCLGTYDLACGELGLTAADIDEVVGEAIEGVDLTEPGGIAAVLSTVEARFLCSLRGDTDALRSTVRSATGSYANGTSYCGSGRKTNVRSVSDGNDWMPSATRFVSDQLNFACWMHDEAYDGICPSTPCIFSRQTDAPDDDLLDACWEIHGGVFTFVVDQVVCSIVRCAVGWPLHANCVNQRTLRDLYCQGTPCLDDGQLCDPDTASCVDPTPICSNECTSGTRCNGSSVENCGQYDGDTCMEWGGATSCPYGCASGACNPAPCSNECTSGTRCNGSSVESCGQYDGDTCMDWGGATSCSNGCSGGVCNPTGCSESEPNDSSSNTDKLTTGSPCNGTISGMINSSSDVDWYDEGGGNTVVNLPAGVTLRYQLTVPSGADFDIELFGPNASSSSQTFLVGSYRRAGQSESIAYTTQRSGPFSLRVYGYGGSTSSLPYTLTYSR